MLLNLIERNFILVILAFFTLSLFEPGLFTWIKPFITVLLGIILFGIGFTLESNDFKATIENRWTIALAIIARYFFMPTASFFIGKFLHLSSLELIGLVILGTCPGGTAANVMSYLARGNVAMTVMLTFGTTIAAPIAMPALIYFFLHKEVTVPFWSMVENILLVVFLPLSAGIIINKYFNHGAKRLAKYFPAISVVAIALAIACIMSLSRDKIISFPFWIISAVILLNLSGYLLGFLTSKALKCKLREQKSLFFEYGMFDCGLGVIIASHFFGPIAALPSAFISIIQNITASLFVRRFSQAPQRYSRRYIEADISN